MEVPRQTISVNIFWETLIGVIADVSDGWCTPTRWKNRNLSNHFGQIRMQSSRCIKKRKSQDTCDLAGILARLDALKCVDPMQCVTQPKGLHVYTVKILLKNTWWELQGQGNWIFEIIKQFNCAMSCAFLSFFIYLYIYICIQSGMARLSLSLCVYVWVCIGNIEYWYTHMRREEHVLWYIEYARLYLVPWCQWVWTWLTWLFDSQLVPVDLLSPVSNAIALSKAVAICCHVWVIVGLTMCWTSPNQPVFGSLSSRGTKVTSQSELALYLWREAVATNEVGMEHLHTSNMSR